MLRKISILFGVLVGTVNPDSILHQNNQIYFMPYVIPGAGMLVYMLAHWTSGLKIDGLKSSLSSVMFT